MTPVDDFQRFLELLQSLVILLQEKPEDSRRPALTEFVRASLEVCFDARYHFSEVCEALADFALIQTERWPQPEALTWSNIVPLLRAVAEEAEAEGRQLP